MPRVNANSIYLSDLFNRANSTTTLGNADTGQTWSSSPSQWGISSNRAYCVSGATGGTFIASIANVAKDIDMSFTLNPIGNAGGTNTGTMFRYLNSSNFMLVSMEDGSAPRTGKVKLNKVVAGVFTQLGIFDPSISGGVSATLRVIAIGSMINVYRNGVLVISVTDSANMNNTGIGFRQLGTTNGDNNFWDNLSVAVTTGGSTSRTTALGLRPLISRSSNNNAARFLGATNLSILDNASLSTEGVDFSAAVWINPSSLPAGSTGINLMGKDNNSAGNREWHLVYATTTNSFIFRTQNSGTNLMNVIKAQTLSVNTWYLAIITYNFSTRTGSIYVNNGSASTGVATGDITASGAAFKFGGGIGFGSSFNGRIQSGGFWKKVLTAAERTQLWNNGKTLRYVDVSGSTIPTSLSGWWDLGEASGSRADSSGNGNTLTDSGSTGSIEGNVAVVRSLAGARTLVT